jgi:hypothetical protein
MSVLIVFASCSSLRVFNGSQSYEALFVNVDSQGINAHKCYVNPQIELVTIEQHGIINVLTNNAALL